MRKKIGSRTERVVVLGLDASLTHTGVLFLDDKFKVRESMTLKSKHKKVARLKDIRDGVTWLIKKHRKDLKLAVMEGYAFNAARFGASRSHSIGEMGGVLKVAMVECSLPIYMVAPMSLKKFATGHGRGDKNQILLKVYQKYGIELQDDHQTDAWILAMIGQTIWHLQTKKTWPQDIKQYEKEVVNTVIKGNQNVQSDGN